MHMEKKSHLATYLQFVNFGYSSAGFTRDDVAANGGVEKLQGKLHDFAAYELMAAENIATLALARIAVRKFASECARKHENNNYDYSGT